MNVTNLTAEELKEILLSQMLKTWLLEKFYLYLIIPMGVIGSVLNLLSLLVFLSKKLRNVALFKYMAVYSLTSLILAFSQIFFFYFTANTFYDLALSTNGRIFSCYIINSVILFSFFYGNALDIFINLERALNFTNKHEKLKNTSPYLISLIAFIFCLIIYTPSFMSLEIVPKDETYVRMAICDFTEFVSSRLGKIILTISYLIEGPVILILVIISNLLSLISYKQFTNRKKELNRVNNTQVDNKKLKRIRNNEKDDRKLLFMTSYFSLFSLIFHAVQFTAQFNYFISNNVNTKSRGWVIFIYVLGASVKQFFSIFFYYNFNKKFKKTLIGFFIKNSKSNSRQTKPNSARNT